MLLSILTLSLPMVKRWHNRKIFIKYKRRENKKKHFDDYALFDTYGHALLNHLKIVILCVPL